MRRRAFLFGVGAAAVAAGVARAQAPRKPFLIVFPNSLAADLAIGGRLDRFLRTMRDLGYLERQDFVIDLAQSPDVPAEVRRQLALSPDVIVTSAAPAARAAAAAASTLPIVALGLTDPAAQIELVGADFSRPKGNVTGIGLGEQGVAILKAVELARELMPRAAVIGFLRARSDQVAEAAAGLGFRSVFVEREERDPLAPAFAALVREGVHVAYTSSLFRTEAPESEFRRFSMETRVPVLFGRIENVEAGGLLAYGSDPRDYFVRAAHFADRLMRGAKVTELPFEQYLEFRLAINLKTARELGITFPPSILARADVVIE